MTILATTIWGGRVSFVVDRQISCRSPLGTRVVATDASKLLAVLCGNALFSVAYTGVAVANSKWLDEVIANCLAFKEVHWAMVQPGSWFLARPVHELLQNLAFSLPIRLRSNKALSAEGLTLAVAGWHLGPRLRPFVWELTWIPSSCDVGGNLKMTRHKVAKHLRHYRRGLWLQTWGDTGTRFEAAMHDLTQTVGYTHDDVERHIVNAIAERSKETETVGSECLAIQLDPTDRDGHVQFSYYPSIEAIAQQNLLSGWVLTPRLISAPINESTAGGPFSPCGNYVTGGFSDANTNLFVRTRLPLKSMIHGGPITLSYTVAPRVPPTW